MKIIISNKINLSDVPGGLLTELKSRLSFTNPRWEENNKRGFWNGETPRVLRFYETGIRQLLYVYGIRSELLNGEVSGKEREKIVERLNKGVTKVVIATGQLIGEGFDCPGLSNLFLVTPIKFSGRVIQYIGRILRPAPGKEKARVYDYVDSKIPVLVASSNARARVYASKFRE